MRKCELVEKKRGCGESECVHKAHIEMMITSESAYAENLDL